MMRILDKILAKFGMLRVRHGGITIYLRPKQLTFPLNLNLWCSIKERKLYINNYHVHSMKLTRQQQTELYNAGCFI